MNHECPTCKKNLRFRLIRSSAISGTKNMQGHSYCPLCKTPLMLNEHPAEKIARTILSVSGIVFFVLFFSKNEIAMNIGLVVFFVSILFAIYIWLRPSYKNWSRWVVFAESKSF